jgi:hypothetical protein
MTGLFITTLERYALLDWRLEVQFKNTKPGYGYAFKATVVPA